MTGACGQVGCELLPYLRSIYGKENVIATDVREAPARLDPNTEGHAALLAEGPFEKLDVTDFEALEGLINKHEVGTIIHLAALLSATGEKNPQLALHINNQGVTNVLEAARQHALKVFSPSTIAVFGPSTPKANTPDETVMRPTTMYGVTKVHSLLFVPSRLSPFASSLRTSTLRRRRTARSEPSLVSTLVPHIRASVSTRTATSRSSPTTRVTALPLRTSLSTATSASLATPRRTRPPSTPPTPSSM